MSARKPDSPVRVDLSKERKQDLLKILQAFYSEEFDEELSPYRAQRILDFFIKSLGPPLYNQAIADARAYMSKRLDDLDAEFYLSEEDE